VVEGEVERVELVVQRQWSWAAGLALLGSYDARSLEPRLHAPSSLLHNDLTCAAIYDHDDMATIAAALQRLSSPPAQTLRTLQPTQATVSYTVSTRPEAKTVHAKLSFYTGIALRILVGTAVALLAWAKWSASREVPAVALSSTLGDARAEELLQLVSRVPWRYLVPVSVCTVYLALRRGYTGTLLGASPPPWHPADSQQ
jgi:hypothetical protein